MATKKKTSKKPSKTRRISGPRASSKKDTTTALALVPRPIAGVDAGLVLDTAPRMFDLARRASGIAAVLFEYVRVNALFVQAGHDTMQEYAAAKLGICSNPYFKKACQAGAAVWSLYPVASEAVMRSLPRDGYPGIQLDNPPPSVPNLSVLARLPAALRKLPEEEHVEFLADVVAGNYTRSEIEEISKRQVGPETPPAAPGNGESPGEGSEAEQASAGTENAGGDPHEVAEQAETTILTDLRCYFPNTCDKVLNWAERQAATGQENTVLSIGVLASYEKLRLVSYIAQYDQRVEALVGPVRRLLDAFDALGTPKQAERLLRRVPGVENTLVRVLGESVGDQED